MAEHSPLKILVGIVVGVLMLVTLLGVAFEVNPFETIGENIMQYVFLGTSTLDDVQTSSTGGLAQPALVLVALMVWLIIFVAFGDILENFSAFSVGIGWIVAFAIAVIAANTKLSISMLVWITSAFAWAGTVAVYAALFAAFIAFFAVNWGIGSLSNWLKTRNEMIRANTGKYRAAAGLRALTAVEKAAAEEGR